MAYWLVPLDQWSLAMREEMGRSPARVAKDLTAKYRIDATSAEMFRVRYAALNDLAEECHVVWVCW